MRVVKRTRKKDTSTERDVEGKPGQENVVSRENIIRTGCQEKERPGGRNFQRNGSEEKWM